MAFTRDLLDFDVRIRFENNLYGSSGLRIHDRHQHENGFIMLATFKRYLFQLN
jgi:hypothetical protein